VARLKLRPRYQLDVKNGIVRIDAAPTYDAPPDVEELFREAARNHQLERAYHAERQAEQVKRREADQERRIAVAREFLSDPTRRALAHPTPSSKRCVLETSDGRIFFDADTDVCPARDVPAEAHRRFRADMRAQREQNLKTRAALLAQHEEKKTFAANWIAEYGTPKQRERLSAGVLPIEEAVEAMTDRAFAPVNERRAYVADGKRRIEELLNGRDPQQSSSVRPTDVIVKSADAETMTSSQWALVNEFQVLLPDARIVLRVHKISWKADSRLILSPSFGILVTQRVGPFTLRREFAAV
jgi:hypothetical protein